MEFSEGSLVIGKELTELDKKVLDFVSELERLGIDYVVVSGYVAILTGRSRGTEDIDFLIDEESVTLSKLEKLLQDYWCIDTSKEEMLNKLEDDLSIRLAEIDEVIPNFELFYPASKWDNRALEDKLEAELGDSALYISPLELQIAYKLYLGAEKDIEDALHLFTVFHEELDMQKLEKYVDQMGVEDEFGRIREA